MLKDSHKKDTKFIINQKNVLFDEITDSLQTIHISDNKDNSVLIFRKSTSIKMNQPKEKKHGLICYKIEINKDISNLF